MRVCDTSLDHHQRSTPQPASHASPAMLEQLEPRLLLDSAGPLVEFNTLPLDGQSIVCNEFGIGPAGGPIPGEQAVVRAVPQGDGGTSGGTPAIISGITEYIWHHGCGPTAAGMVIGYWDSHGFPNLVAGDAGTQTGSVDAMIASTEHYADYSLPIDDDGTGLRADKSTLGGGHSNNSVADWMHTSWSKDGLYYGWSSFSRVDDAVDSYCEWKGYSGFDTYNEIWGAFTWGDLVAEIDANRPMILLVDTNANNKTDHFVTAVGYDSATNRYGCHDTYDSTSSVQWYDFAEMDNGQTYGIYGATFVHPPDIGNHRPILSDPTVTPLHGDSDDNYVFSVHYYDQDGDSPLYGQTQLYVSGDGTPHQMTRISGSAADGVYSTGQLSLASGSYQHLFRAFDTGGLDDVLGWLPGPYVGLAEGNDFIDISRHWEDDPPNADGDGVVEAGEDVLLEIKLRSAAGAHDVDAVLSTTDNDIDITAWGAYYDDFASGEWQWGHGDFNMELDFSLSPGQTRRSDFTLTVTYELAGQQYFQNIDFAKTFHCDGDIGASFEVVGVEIDDSPSIVYRNNGDGIFQTGERVHLRPVLRNSGTWAASNIRVELYYSGTASARIDVRPGYERYPDLSTGGSAAPEAGEHYPIISDDLTFTGSVPIGIRVDWDENTGDAVEFDNAFYLPVQPAPIIDIVEETWGFGVVPPGEQVNHSIRVVNRGTQLLSVSNVTASPPDNTTIEHQSFSVGPGGYHDVPVSIDTTGIPNGTSISRLITVVSDGRLMHDTPPSNTTTISGTVRDGSIWSLPDSVPAPYYTIDISGTRIVWQDGRSGDDIYVYDAATGEETNLTPIPSGQEAPRISGDIVAWTDYRNGNGDIYAFDLASQQEFLVAGTTDREELVGVDGDWIAFARQDFTYDSYGASQSGQNVYIYEISSGQITKITDYSASPGSPLWSANVSSDRGDFADGVLVWIAGRHAWIGGGNGWSDGATSSYVTKYAIGVDSNPQNLKDGFEGGPVTSGGRVVWTEDVSTDDQLFLWESGSITQITSSDKDVGVDALAFSGDIIVYDKGGSSNPGLFYWDLSTGQEYVLTASPESCEAARMDGNGIVWLGTDPGPKVFYIFLNPPDLAILPMDVQVSNESPAEGDSIDVSVLVRNVSDYDATSNITVQLYWDSPDPGNEIGDPVVIPGLGAGAEAPREIAITVPENAGTDESEPHNVYASLTVDGFDNPDNNTAYRGLDVSDDDTEGPSISNIIVAEHDGDGDGIIGADEQLQISWELTDPSGIGPVSLWVDMDQDGLGTPEARDADDFVALDGDYFAIFAPIDSGMYAFAIDAEDADNSPAMSTHTGSFEVVAAEEITILYEGHPLAHGETTAILFGPVAHGAPSVTKMFIVRNDGEQVLSLGAISAPVGFSVSGPESTVIDPEGGWTYFTVALNTEVADTFTGNVSLANTDTDENPFTFAISGQVDPVSDSPGTPNLMPDSDTGLYDYDDMTNRDNDAGRTMDFEVTGTVAGATVRIYAGSTVIGSAEGEGTTTTVTTDGDYDLTDGPHLITATQEELGKAESDPSGPLGITVDTVAPTLEKWYSAATHGALGELLLEIADDGAFTEPRTGGIRMLVLEFSEEVDLSGASVDVAGNNDDDGPPMDLSDIDVDLAGRDPIPPDLVFSDTAEISFSSPVPDAGLPDVARYLVHLDGVIADRAGNALTGDHDRIMTSLIGDMKGDHYVVDVRDLYWAWAYKNQDADEGPGQTRADMDLNGTIDVRDLYSAWGKKNNRAAFDDPVLSKGLVAGSWLPLRVNARHPAGEALDAPSWLSLRVNARHPAAAVSSSTETVEIPAVAPAAAGGSEQAAGRRTSSGAGAVAAPGEALLGPDLAVGLADPLTGEAM